MDVSEARINRVNEQLRLAQQALTTIATQDAWPANPGAVAGMKAVAADAVAKIGQLQPQNQEPTGARRLWVLRQRVAGHLGPGVVVVIASSHAEAKQMAGFAVDQEHRDHLSEFVLDEVHDRPSDWYVHGL